MRKFVMCNFSLAPAEEAAEEEAPAEVISISTAEELAAVANDLSGSYLLTADIDLGGAEWTPIGTFVQMGAEGEEAETPNAEFAFTGVFDGGGQEKPPERILPSSFRRNFIPETAPGTAPGGHSSIIGTRPAVIPL